MTDSVGKRRWIARRGKGTAGALPRPAVFFSPVEEHPSESGALSQPRGGLPSDNTSLRDFCFDQTKVAFHTKGFAREPFLSQTEAFLVNAMN